MKKITVKCLVNNCDERCSHNPTGYCSKHYVCWRRTGDPIPQKKARRDPICSVEDCFRKHRRNGLCSKHSTRMTRHGDPLKIDTNQKHFTEEEKHVALKMRQRKYNATDGGKAATKRKTHRRRHLEASDVQLTTEDYQYIHAIFDNRCFNCGTDEDITFDHHIPLSKGGKFTRDNIVLLCRYCNGIKSDKDPKEFYSEEQLKLLKSQQTIN